MIKINDNSIFVGEIKQILKDFNLPNCQVEDVTSNDYIACKGKYSIWNHNIYTCRYNTTTSKYEPILVKNYEWNAKHIGLTTNLKIDNLVYDSYTHRYLGNYLRFLRDYRGMNLMSMYNCIDNVIIDNSICIDNIHTFENNSFFKVYSIPVLYNQLYTIYSNSSTPIDVCLYLENVDNLKTKSYRHKVIKGKYLYNVNQIINALQDNDKMNIIRKYTQLKMIVSVPVDTKIVVLEGNYINTDTRYTPLVYKNAETNELMTTRLVTNPQLFSFEAVDGEYVLADKLIGYLTGNTITDLSEGYDIKKYQVQLKKHNLQVSNYYGLWTDREKTSTQIWIHQNNLYKKCYDMLPYCDDDVEATFNGDLI